MRVARVACVSCAAAVLVAHVAWECVRGSCDTCVLLCAAAVLVPTHTHLAHGLRVCVCVPSRVSCAVLGDIYVKAEWACVCAVPCLLFAVLGNPYVKVECCVCVCVQPTGGTCHTSVGYKCTHLSHVEANRRDHVLGEAAGRDDVHLCEG